MNVSIERGNNMRLHFITGNKGKLEEAKAILSNYGFEVKMIDLKKVEIQSDNLEDVAVHAIKLIDNKYAPVFVEDAGLFVEKLKGFPGPYSSYVYKTIGCDGILKLLEGEKGRSAYFMAVVALKLPSGEVKVFKGVTRGVIARVKRGSRGFGFDPIFVPTGSVQTFAEMDIKEKNLYSHRGKAMRAMAEWIIANLDKFKS